MKFNLYSVRDTLAEVFNKPFTEVNDATAKRSFANGISEWRNKDDYALYYLGQLDDQTGELHAAEPKKIYSGLEVPMEDVQGMPQSLQEQAS